MDQQKKPKIAVLASGDGSNFEAIVEATRDARLRADVVGVISNRSGAKVLERARRLGVPSEVLLLSAFPSPESWNQAIFETLSKWQAEWVILAGFTGLIGGLLLERFPARIVNSHPSLLPKFGGKGMYGIRVHEAVVKAKETETGITVHLINERFDEGPVLAQTRIPVHREDTPQTLAEKLKAEERKFYPAVLQDLLTGRIKYR